MSWRQVINLFMQRPTIPARQVHLDFHTSEHIPGVGSAFSADEFGEQFARAHVNSVTLFAKCHHGYAYYPSAICPQHPGMTAGQDLLGQQIEALHRRRIRCPIYLTVGWDALSARNHPEWRQLLKSGHFATWTGHPGIWENLNWLHPQYQDHMAGLVEEIGRRYGAEVDGYFFDICNFMRGACWSPESVKFREKHGLLSDDNEGFERFQSVAQREFSAMFSRIINGITPKSSIFFNAASEVYMAAGVGGRARFENMTHMEVESLPSGIWGYFHFPRLARSTSYWGKPWLGMTGRFQSSWGDFGGIKPKAALEFECFRAQAMGGAMSIGDQLSPDGTLEVDSIGLIGAVYEQMESADAFYEGSEPLPTIGILTANIPQMEEAEIGKSDEGAILMCEELHYDSRLFDGDCLDFHGLPLVIVNDTTELTEAQAGRLRDYYSQGGNLIVTHRGGVSKEGKWLLDFLPMQVLGEAATQPSYWRIQPGLLDEPVLSDRVIYSRGMECRSDDAEVWVERVLPVFERNSVTYCSHAQAPPRREGTGSPAILKGDRFVYFADPIFSEYRKKGNLILRKLWAKAVEKLIGPPPFGAGLPTTVQVYPRRKADDLLLTLLHYIPIRKALEGDVIEERHGFGGLILEVPPEVKTVISYPAQSSLLKLGPGRFELPTSPLGRLLLSLPGAAHVLKQ